MDILKRLSDFIASLDNRDLYKYILLFIFSIILFLLIIFYIQYKIVSNYEVYFKTLDDQRRQASKIISDFKIRQKEIAHVEEILSLDKNFIIGQKYLDIINKLSLSSNLVSEPKINKGESDNIVSEIVLNSSLQNINTHQLVNLLSLIADIKQLYPKELTIKRSSNNNQTIDIDLTIATLEKNI